MSYEEFQTITKLIVENCEPCKLSKVLSAIQNLIDEHEIDNKKSKTLHFTKQEIDKMPKTFKKEFRTNGCTAHIYKRKTSKTAFTYDIRYRRNGYNICITDKNLENAKTRFIEALKYATPIQRDSFVPKTFNAFAMYYFETFRKRKVTESTMKNDMNRYNMYLKPLFKERPLKDVTSKECQLLIDDLTEKGKCKTADEIFSLLNVIFKCAIQHDLIKNNPLNIIVHTHHESEHGIALTKQEENMLKTSLDKTSYKNAFMLALYTGLRPNELITAKVEGKMIIAVNSKRKTRNIQYKKIPICKMLEPYITTDGFGECNASYMREYIKTVLPNHKLYDLRTTFHSRLKECGVAREAREEFIGHSNGKLEDAYTSLSDEYLIREMEKFVY